MISFLRRIGLTSVAGIGLLILIVGAGGWMHFLRTRAAAPSPTPTHNAQTDVEVFFTRPEEPGLRGGERALTALVAGLDAARLSIDVACYHVNLEEIAAALLRAQGRGVVVRLVTDDEQANEPVLQSLARSGIVVKDDGSPSLMHHKFIVIDGDEVWTGSMNLTTGSVYHDDNNLLHLRSAEIAADFSREFEEMYRDNLFGALSEPDTPYAQTGLEGMEVEVLFSPDDGVARRLVRLIGEADESIDVLAFAFTSDALADAMLERREQGVRLRGVMERDQADAAGAEYFHVLGAGAEFRLDNSYGNMHHKVILIDGDTVVTGSYNFTRSAEMANDEALLILRSPALAAVYAEEFERLYAEASPE
jgi:phosphatidylserine/phosphatidylglycerophosphate/cardiolipin synthase-like enzyme